MAPVPDGGLAVTDTQSAALFSLPVELRMEIWRYVVLDREQIILMAIPSIPDQPTPRQPAASLVSRQLREEVLDAFYENNIFVIKLFDKADLAKMASYFNTIGDDRVRKLRRLSLCSWAKLGFGHMLNKWWWRVDVDLRCGEATWQREITWADERRMMESFKASFKTSFDAKQGAAWTADELLGVMKIFVMTCAAY